MHTECPECRTAFRLTVAVLRQAHGRVRCGGCGHVFDALDFLQDERSGKNPPKLDETSAGDRFERQSRALLESLDRLAGPDDVRIEDTGVEWRVLDTEDDAEDDLPANDAAVDPSATGSMRWYFEEPAEDRRADEAQAGKTQAELDLERAGDAADEMRYDDNTPLPDDDDRDGMPATPRRRAEDVQAPPVSNELQVDLALGDEDDWRALLDEVGTDSAEDDREGAEDDRDAAEAELESALADASDSAADDDIEAPTNLQIDAGSLRAASGDEKAAAERAAPPDPASGLFETIVMEGETVRDALDDDDSGGEEAAHDESVVLDPVRIEPKHAPAPPRPAWLGIAAAAVLGFLLAAQLVHANRESLATIGAVQQTLGPIYRALGKPLVPAWNIRGWRFEATNGSTDANGERLTIHSRIVNKSEQALPYPLVHVSLTDRFEEVIGSRILSADDYLAGGADFRRPVAPGQDFTAVVAIDAPSADATGFKLNVCYRLAGERLRCAIEDFKN